MASFSVREFHRSRYGKRQKKKSNKITKNNLFTDTNVWLADKLK